MVQRIERGLPETKENAESLWCNVKSKRSLSAVGRADSHWYKKHVKFRDHDYHLTYSTVMHILVSSRCTKLLRPGNNVSNTLFMVLVIAYDGHEHRSMVALLSCRSPMSRAFHSYIVHLGTETRIHCIVVEYLSRKVTMVRVRAMGRKELSLLVTTWHAQTHVHVLTAKLYSALSAIQHEQKNGRI